MADLTPMSQLPVVISGTSPTQAPARPSGWFSADADFKHCFQSRSPAQRIEELKAAGGQVMTVDRLSEGQMIGVDVTAAEGPLSERTWTYFRSKEACEAQLRADNAIPDKYR